MMAQVPARSDDEANERLVALRGDVLHDAEHAVGNLLQRFWLETQGLQQVSLESFVADGAPA